MLPRRQLRSFVQTAQQQLSFLQFLVSHANGRRHAEVGSPELKSSETRRALGTQGFARPYVVAEHQLDGEAAAVAFGGDEDLDVPVENRDQQVAWPLASFSEESAHTPACMCANGLLSEEESKR